jgi:hypothetical protein
MSAKFDLKQSSNGQFFFSLKAGNSEIVLSSEMYKEKSGAQNGIASVKKNSPDDARYDRRQSVKGEPYFVLKAGNGEIIGKSEMYSSASAMEKGIASVKKNAPEALVVDSTG